MGLIEYNMFKRRLNTVYREGRIGYEKEKHPYIAINGKFFEKEVILELN